MAFNPLTPGTFCQKCRFLDILVVFRLDLSQMAQLELEGTMTLKSDLERLGQTILNSLFLTDMLMIGTLYLILLCQLPV